MGCLDKMVREGEMINLTFTLAVQLLIMLSILIQTAIMVSAGDLTIKYNRIEKKNRLSNSNGYIFNINIYQSFPRILRQIWPLE